LDEKLRLFGPPLEIAKLEIQKTGEHGNSMGSEKRTQSKLLLKEIIETGEISR
jgi:hypothetical protein